jgi:hypothetical protein
MYTNDWNAFSSLSICFLLVCINTWYKYDYPFLLLKYSLRLAGVCPILCISATWRLYSSSSLFLLCSLYSLLFFRSNILFCSSVLFSGGVVSAFVSSSFVGNQWKKSSQ